MSIAARWEIPFEALDPTTSRVARDTAVIGFVLLVAVSGIDYSFAAMIPNLRRLLAYPLCAVVNFLLIGLGWRASRANASLAPRVVQWLYPALLLWGALLIVRSFDPAPTGIRDTFFTHWGALTYLLPLVAYCSLRPRFWPRFWRYGVYFLVGGIVIVSGYLVAFMLGISNRYLHVWGQYAGNLTVPVKYTVLFLAPLFYLAGLYICRRSFFIGSLGLLVWLILAFFIDSRESIVLIGWYLFCSLIETRRASALRADDRAGIVFCALILVLVLLLGGGRVLYRNITTDTLDTRVEQFFFEGGSVLNTRRGLAEDLFRDLTYLDILFGRGAVASYYTDLVGLDQSHLAGNRRQQIEIGHLQHTLNGGLVQNVLFNVLGLTAVYLGIWRSHNGFTRALAFIIAGWLMMMVTAAIPIGGMRYYLVWLAIGGCWSTELRAMSNDELIEMWRHERAGNRLFDDDTAYDGLV